MQATDFTLTLLSTQTPRQVFQAILNVRRWWTGYFEEVFSGNHEKQGDEFSFTAANGIHQCTMKIVELIPDQKMVWLVTSSKLDFVNKTDEWTGTKVIFDIKQTGSNTELTFTHQGLTPAIECYTSCAPSWTSYLQNKLLPLINFDQPAPGRPG